MKKRNPRFATILASALLATTLAHAEVLPPAQDSCSLKGILTPSTGKAPTLVVSAARKTYVRFNLASLPDGIQASDIVSARLRVYFPRIVKAGALHVVTVAGDWSETGTLAEPPLDANPIATIPSTAMVGKRFADVDVTAAVQAWANGASNFGFALVSDGTANVMLGAKEGPGTGYPMELEVSIDRTQGGLLLGQSANVFIGVGAGAGNATGASNTGIGDNALHVNDGAGNTAIGWNTLPLNTTGANNTALGSGALSGNTTGSHNIAIGDGAGSGLTTGDHNIDIGAAGAAGEANTIRLGTEGVQANTLLVGHVGIGTETPTQARLVVSGIGDNHVVGPYGYLANLAIGTVGFNGGNNSTSDVSIYASNAIEGTVFRAFSDERIKNVQGRSNAAADLETLLGLAVTDYTYKDPVTKGAGAQKKLIAQQVEKVFPQAVSRTTDVIPDIFRKATLEDGWVQLETDLKTGERVRLIGEKGEGVYEVLEAQEGRFRTAFQSENKQIFVYGREVKDFRVVDYEAVAMLNVSATQELHRELQARDAEIAALKKQIAASEAHERAQEARLARLEAALRAPAAQPVRATLRTR